MRKIIIALTFLTFTTAAFAEVFQDTVHSYSEGKNNQDHLIYFESGRVVFYSSQDQLPEIGARIEVETDEKNRVRSIISLPQLPEVEEIPSTNAPMSEPTLLNSYSEANKIFGGMNRYYKNVSECTDRAHVWTYEEWKKSGLISRKVFLFFTNTYIRRYNYRWWFHVSPYNHVKNGDSFTEFVMDRRYARSPLYMKTWTDIFIYSKKNCPVTTYRYYQQNKNGVEHCFAVKSHMYNRLPYHVRMQEDYGRVQTQFNINEVNFSYRAFTRRGARK